MRIFEACIHSIAKSEETLENLRYFDTLEIVSSPAPATRPKASGELIAHFDRLLVQERQRLERLGFQARFALGAHAEDLPLRAHPELWRELESRVVQPEVVAVGALGLSSQSTPVEYAALQRQMAIANDHQLPCIVRLAPRRNLGSLRQIFGCAQRAGLPLQQLLLAGLRRAELVALPRHQACHFTPALEELKSLDPAHLQGLAQTPLLSAALWSGPDDILAVPRSLMALGMSTQLKQLEALAYDNAAAFFGCNP